MSTLYRFRPAVKTAVLFNASRPRRGNRLFGLGLGVTRDERLPLGPDPIDSAWDLGYRLGRAGVDADPAEDLAPFAALAFEDGWDRGLGRPRAGGD